MPLLPQSGSRTYRRAAVDDDLWSPAMRLGALLICSSLLVACGKTAPHATDSSTTRPPRAAHAAQQSHSPKRADHQPWPRVPSALSDRVASDVFLAARASEATVRAAGCEAPPEPGARLLGANVDEFALTATFRSVPRNSGNPDLNNRPVIRGCTAKWKREDERWEKVNCGHYAPAGRRHAIARSGGGMIGCFDLLEKPRRERDSPLMVWVEPPPRAQWIVVRRNFEYSVAYPVVGRRPVRLIYPREATLAWADGQATAFPYLVIYKTGRTRRLTATGATAG